MANLQNEMISAVRGAITGVMANRTPVVELPELDLDFSVGGAKREPRLPVLRAEPDRALTVPDAPLAVKRLRWGLVAAGAMVAAAGVAVGLLAASWHGAQPEVQTRPAVAAIVPAPATFVAPAVAPPAPAPAPVNVPPRDELDVARELIGGGKIVQARAVLLGSARKERSAVALVLARSYDPNFLATLTKSDGAADIEQARRWYQRWYELATKEGAVPQTMRLDLLLRSLDHAGAQ